jgi:hypothetical protein
MNRMAHERNLFVQQLDDGRIMFVPLKDGNDAGGRGRS